jgi:hypothetical protein
MPQMNKKQGQSRSQKIPEAARSLYRTIKSRLSGISPERSQSLWKVSLVVLLGFILVMTILLKPFITNRISHEDGRQNLKMAYNLAFYGVMSNSDNPEEELEPTNMREPIPIAAMAAYLKLHPSISSSMSLEEINSEDTIILVKYHNLLWAFLCLLGVAAVVLSAIKPRPAAFFAALAAVWLAQRYFLQLSLVIDRTYTEVQAGALMVWVSFVLIRALQTRKYSWYILSGICLGLMTLIKAVFLYIGIGVLFTLLVVYLVKQTRIERLVNIKLIGVMAVCMTAAIMPWMVRNRIQLGTWSISGRGGDVLFLRATKNQMNSTEFKGAFYLYAPPALKKYIGEYLGFTDADLEAGGSLQRINRDGSSSFAWPDLQAEWAGKPEDAVSFYRSARAERVRLEMYYEEQGAEDPALLAAEELQSRAIQMIKSDPIKHLKTSLVFAWRGTWVDGVRFRYLVAGFAALWILGFWGLLRRNGEMIGITLPSMGVFAFHALFTHFIPRYSMILIPVMMISMVVSIGWILLRIDSQITQKR